MWKAGVRQSKHACSEFLEFEKKCCLLGTLNHHYPCMTYLTALLAKSQRSRMVVNHRTMTYLAFGLEDGKGGAFFKTWEHRRVVQTKTHTFER